MQLILAKELVLVLLMHHLNLAQDRVQSEGQCECAGLGL